ncbi:hypothetical protein HDE_08457 [Halotydeus destructor]|nr:hypothetical protein HDE_08457 [Halotydeus destructor]
MSKEWVNVTEFWCFPDNLPEVMIDNVYECFRLYKGNKEFEAQIRCENELIPLNNTKNDVRRKLCKNDKKAVTLFEKCFVKNGVIVTRTTNGGSRTATSASRSQLSKFRDLISCMKKALKWDELNQGQNTTVAVDDPED